MEQNKFQKVVYICSKYAGNVEFNVKQAKRYCLFAVGEGYIPFAAHLLYPQFLNDNDPEQRSLGLSFGNALMDRCDEMWVFGEELSSGMSAEYERVLAKGYPIRFFTTDCKEVRDGCV